MAPYRGRNDKYSRRKPPPNERRFLPSTVVAVIPFERFQTTTKKKEDILTFKLRSDPLNDASPTYDLTIPYFKSGTPEELFVFLENVEKVIVGQHVHAADRYFDTYFKVTP